MKSLFTGLFLLVLFFGAISCSKSSSSPSTDTIDYEVKITQGTWGGDYYDYANNSESLIFVSHKASGWKYSFTITHGRKVDLVLSAVPDVFNAASTVIANIYLNGKIIKTDSSIYAATAQILINQ